MTDVWALALVVVRVVLSLLGIATTLISYRAYRRGGTRYLRNATVGFGFITLGVLVEGFLYEVTSLTLTQVHVAESAALACGFAVLLSSFVR